MGEVRFMERRTIEELKQDIINRYSKYSSEYLFDKVYYCEKSNCVKHKNNIPTEPLIPYCEGGLNAHAIELTIPGKLTFQDKRTKNLLQSIQSYDVKINLMKNNVTKTPTHVDIVKDLYEKISSVEDKQRQTVRYHTIGNMLVNIHSNVDVMTGISVTNEQREYNCNWGTGYSIAELVSFIKWCAAQEDLNYNQPGNWGKDLSFARYFEALWAGFYRDVDLLELIKKRTRNHGRDKPILWDAHIYGNVLNHRRI